MAGRTSAVEPEDEGRVYDDDGLMDGRDREEALTAVAAVLTGAVAGFAAEEGAGASTGFLAAKPEDGGRLLDGDLWEVPPVADFFSVEAPEGVWRVLDGDVVFFPPVAVFLSAERLGLGLAEEEEEASDGKLSSVFSYGLGAVAVEEEAAAVGQAAAAGAVPATTTGAVPGFWTM